MLMMQKNPWYSPKKAVCETELQMQSKCLNLGEFPGELWLHVVSIWRENSSCLAFLGKWGGSKAGVLRRWVGASQVSQSRNKMDKESLVHSLIKDLLVYWNNHPYKKIDAKSKNILSQVVCVHLLTGIILPRWEGWWDGGGGARGAILPIGRRHLSVVNN